VSEYDRRVPRRIDRESSWKGLDPDGAAVDKDGGDAEPRAPGSKNSNPKDHQASTKVPFWLLSPVAKAWWALGQLAGLTKYGAWNWRKTGVLASVYLSAIERHLEKFKAGERLSKDDRVHHLGHIMACCGIMLDAEACGKFVDDRPPSYSLEECFEECERTAQHLFETHLDKKPRHYGIDDTQECFGKKL